MLLLSSPNQLIDFQSVATFSQTPFSSQSLLTSTPSTPLNPASCKALQISQSPFLQFLHRLLRRRAPLHPASLLSQHRCQPLVSLRPLGLFQSFLHRLLRRRAPLRPALLLSQHSCQPLVSLRPLGLFRFLHRLLLRRAPLRPASLLSHHRPRVPVSFRPLGLFRVLRRTPSHHRFLSLRRPQVSSALWGPRLARNLPRMVKAPPRRRRPSPQPSCRVSLRIRPARTTTALLSPSPSYIPNPPPGCPDRKC